MEIAFIRPFFIMRGSGLRVLFNWCKGLIKKGHEVTVITLYGNDEVKGALPEGASLVYLKPIEQLNFPTFRSLTIMDVFTSSVRNDLAELIRGYPGPDFYILIDDYALSLSDIDRRTPLGFWCQGLPQTLFLSEVSPFLKSKHKIARFILKSLSTPIFLRTICKIGGFDFVLSNSHYTSDWLYFFTRIRSKVIYPPVDCEFFKPKHESGESNYMLAFGSITDRQMIEKLGEKYPIINVGTEKAKNCKNLGYVSDEQLIQLYSDAFLTLFPQFHEPFGYVPVESMACGTPVIAYNAEGPRETVVNGVRGWLADRPEDFIKIVGKIWKERYDENIRKICRNHVLNNFSIEVCVNKLLNYLSKTAAEQV